MPPLTTSIVLQLLLGLGLLNVWLLRSGTATRYRGGDARSLREEFAAYGLPTWFFFLVGFLKVGSAVALLVGAWYPETVLPAAGMVVLLMLGALAMHVKVKDPAIKSLPAFLMLAMSAGLCVLQLG
jgi:uncharacterized membrane protein YphA (DoxX/SURF4 family)